jgi:hypothetical protein
MEYLFIIVYLVMLVGLFFAVEFRVVQCKGDCYDWIEQVYNRFDWIKKVRW